MRDRGEEIEKEKKRKKENEGNVERDKYKRSIKGLENINFSQYLHQT